RNVTGVQTCALPIYAFIDEATKRAALSVMLVQMVKHPRDLPGRRARLPMEVIVSIHAIASITAPSRTPAPRRTPGAAGRKKRNEIGRASCREREKKK